VARYAPTDNTAVATYSAPPDGSNTTEPTNGFPARSLRNVSIEIEGSLVTSADASSGSPGDVGQGIARFEYTTNGGGAWATVDGPASVQSTATKGVSDTDSDSDTGPWSHDLGDIADISQLGVRCFASGSTTGTADNGIGTSTITDWWLEFDQLGGIVGA
jgi:hypothetical protein